MFTAQELNTKVTFQRHVQGEDEAGQPIDSWENYADAFAKVEPLVGREYLQAQQLPSGETNIKVTLRWRPDVTRLHRVLIRGEAFEITDAQNIRLQNRELLLYCTRIT